MTVMWCYAKKDWQRQRDHGDIDIAVETTPAFACAYVIMNPFIISHLYSHAVAFWCNEMPSGIYVCFWPFLWKSRKGAQPERERVCVAWRCVNFTNLIQLISISWHSGKHKSSDDINLKPNYKIQNTWHVEHILKGTRIIFVFAWPFCSNTKC